MIVFFIFLISISICWQLDANICSEIGFNSESLQCSTCERVLVTLNDDDIYQKCLSCCIQDEVRETTTYNYAVLEVDKRFTFDKNSDLNQIIKNKKALGLKVRDMSSLQIPSSDNRYDRMYIGSLSHGNKTCHTHVQRKGWCKSSWNSSSWRMVQRNYRGLHQNQSRSTIDMNPTIILILNTKSLDRSLHWFR